MSNSLQFYLSALPVIFCPCTLKVYRQCATIYTDEWEAYRGVLPQKLQMPSATLRERVVSKDSGKTSYIVRVSVAKQNDSITHYGSVFHDLSVGV